MPTEGEERLAGRREAFDHVIARLTQGGRGVLTAPVWSGTTDLLGVAIEQLGGVGHRALYVDVNRAADLDDLVGMIGSAAIRATAPDLAAWWGRQPTSPTSDRETVALSSLPAGSELPRLHELRGRQPLLALQTVFALAEALMDHRGVIILDHADELDSAKRRFGAPYDVTEALRVVLQRSTTGWLLVGREGGPVGRWHVDPDHPLYLAGMHLALPPVSPESLALDLAASIPSSLSDATMLRLCRLGGSVPWIAARAVEIAVEQGLEPEAALDRLTTLYEPTIAERWRSAASLHRLAPAILRALVEERSAYALAPDKLVGDGLRRLEAARLIRPARTRRGGWTVVDPLLARWIVAS